MGEASHPGPTSKRRRMLRSSRRVWDSDEQSSSIWRGPTQVDSDSEDEFPFQGGSPDLLAALEQDLCEGNDNSQSQQVVVEFVDPGLSWHVMGVACRAVNSGVIAETPVLRHSRPMVTGAMKMILREYSRKSRCPHFQPRYRWQGRVASNDRFFSLATDSEEQIDRRTLIDEEIVRTLRVWPTMVSF